MSQAPIPEDLRELYIASLQRRNRSIGSEVSGEDFVLNVNARTHCNLIERIAALEAQVQTLREALEAIIRRVALVSPYYEQARAALAATERKKP